MQIKKIKINNLASFREFENDTEFCKENLFFGTNGSGKTTLVSLLQYIQSYKQNDTTENELKNFLKKRISKESNNNQINVQIAFNSSVTTFHYDYNSDTLTSSDGDWYPIKVFNDDYTDRNIGENISMDFPDSGLIIGEINRELEEARKERDSIERKIEGRIKYLQRIVDSTIETFKQLTQSTRNVQGMISVENLRNITCDYVYDETLIQSRNELGFVKPERKISKFQVNLFDSPIVISELEKMCNELIMPPKISDEIVPLLKSFSNFYSSGISIYDEENTEICPFCRRRWKNAEEIISDYRAFIESNYSQKRKEIEQAKSKINKYREDVLSQKQLFKSCKKVAMSELKKYQIKNEEWQDLAYHEELHNEIVALLDDKYQNMGKELSIEEPLTRLIDSHKLILNANNDLIDTIDQGIDTITTKRRDLNLKIAQHLMKKIWGEHAKDRGELKEFEGQVLELNTKIAQLEESTKSQDTIQAVFNGLIDFLGLNEYFLDNNKHLNIRLEKSYDISNEGRRISTAQRKLLSLCYFFADIVSEVESVKKLKNYILVFDDPVDSADYIFFHSITAIIEKSESLLKSILKQEKVRFGQFFVFTHNSLLYDRLSCNWKIYRKRLEKVGNHTRIEKIGRKINNYNIYLDEIIKYYKKPKSDRRRMIYVGNLLRRVLEGV